MGRREAASSGSIQIENGHPERDTLRPPHSDRLTTRGQFFATGAAVAAGAASLSSCIAERDPYAAAARRTWLPFDNAVTERRALQHELIRYATLAPSSHNTQCWRFELRRDRIAIEPDWSRRCPAVDPDDHHLFVSLGCATENLIQAARAHGFRSEARFDAAGGGTVTIALESARPEASVLYEAIAIRQCTRGEYDGQSLPRHELHALEAAGRGDGVRVVLLTGRPQVERVLEYVVEGNGVQLNDPSFMAELRRWIRFSDAEAVAKRDGLSTRASGNLAVPRWIGNAMLGVVLTPTSDGDRYAKFIRSSAGIAVFVSDANDKQHWVEAGRCFERFALHAAASNIRTAMLNQPVEVSTMRSRFAAALGLGSGRPDLVVRFGYGREMPRSLRRPVAAVIV